MAMKQTKQDIKVYLRQINEALGLNLRVEDQSGFWNLVKPDSDGTETHPLHASNLSSMCDKLEGMAAFADLLRFRTGEHSLNQVWNFTEKLNQMKEAYQPRPEGSVTIPQEDLRVLNDIASFVDQYFFEFFCGKIPTVELDRLETLRDAWLASLPKE